MDQRSVPLLWRDDLDITGDLTEEQITDYFEFRTRLTFAVLSARQFFSHRYANSDHTRLTIQGFTPERAGGAVLQHRRRDGSARILVPQGKLSIPRPHHISGWCELPRDLDVQLLAALENASEQASPSWPSLAEAVRLFVGANTDGPDISMHAELIDVVSAFSRVAGDWDEKGTVKGFIKALPAPGEGCPPLRGPKAADERVKRGLAEGKSVRAVWLADAYRLRNQFGHGHVEQPPYRSTWTEREHLLLAAVAFPLYLKAVLALKGLYTMTEGDKTMDAALEALALLTPFAEQDEEGEDGSQEGDSWGKTIARAQTRRLAEKWARALSVADPDACGE